MATGKLAHSVASAKSNSGKMVDRISRKDHCERFAKVVEAP